MMQIVLPKLHESQKIVKDSPARFKVVCAGRRFGKSRLAAALATECALRNGVVWIIAPSYSLGESLFSDVKRLAAKIPGVQINLSARLVTYPGSGLVQIRSGDDPSLLRGSSLDMAIFDESAFQPRLEELWLEVIRPSLADRRGKALFLSTPAGQNYFYALYQLGLDPQQPDWQSWQWPTGSNPHIDKAEIENARKQLSERQFSQEFEAEFIDSSGGVFRRVRESATGNPLQTGEPGKRYIYGIDWARFNDSTCYVVIDPQTKRMVYLDRFNQIDYSLQVSRLRALCKRFPPLSMIVEANAMGGPLVERLQREERMPVRPFVTTNASKADVIEALAVALEQGEIEILNDPVLIGELLAYNQERLPSGLLRYGAADNGHDDTVIATALAWYGANSQRFIAPIIQAKAKGWIGSDTTNYR